MTTQTDPNTAACAYCDGPCTLETYSAPLKLGRRSLTVTGFKKWVCTRCGGEHEDEHLSNLNLSTLEAFTSTQHGAVTPGMLRKIRRTWGLSQKEASKIFGAGANSFAKWESRQSRISTPAALLLQTVLHIPQAMSFLAHMADVQLPDHPFAHLTQALNRAKEHGAFQPIDVSDSTPELKIFQQLLSRHLQLTANDDIAKTGVVSVQEPQLVADWHAIQTPSQTKRVLA